MFDIGFWEICLIGIVALLVVGPERLPGVARSIGRWVGKAQRMVNSVKSDINRELEAGELRELLGEQKKQINELKDLVGETKQEMESSTRGAIEASQKSWGEEVAEFEASEEKLQQAADNSILPPQDSAVVAGTDQSAEPVDKVDSERTDSADAPDAVDAESPAIDKNRQTA